MAAVLYIVPSVAAVEAHCATLAESGGVVLGRPAVTLKGLMEELFSRCTPPGRFVSPALRRLLLERLLQRQGGELSAFSTVPGLLAVLEGSFSEFLQGMLSAQDLERVARSAPVRLRELCSLYRQWRSDCRAKGVLDPHDRELASLCHLRDGGALPPLLAEAGGVKVAGIHDFTPLQRSILVELSRRLPVEIELPYDFGKSAAYAAVSRTASAFEAFTDSDISLELVFREPSSPFLDPLPERKEATLVSAPGAYAECEEIGRRIRHLMEQGSDPRGIAVVFRDLREYGPMLEDVCRRFRIPLSVRRGAPLASSPLVRTVLSPFAVARCGLAREELLSLLKSSYGRFLPRGLHPDSLEELLLSLRYRDDAATPLEPLLERRIAALEAEGKDAHREKLALRFLPPLLRELRSFSRSRSPGSFAALLESFIERHGIYRRGLEGEDLRGVKRDAAAIAAFRRILRSLEADLQLLGMDGETIRPEEFLALLQRGMEGEFLGGEKRPGIAVMTFHDIRGLRFPHLFVGGLSEGTTPPRAAPNPLLRDRDKGEIESVLKRRVFKTAAEKMEEEPLLLRLAVGCATQSLTLSCRYADGRGAAVLRSWLLEELLEELRVREETVPVDRVVPLPEECLEPEELLNSLSLQGLSAEEVAAQDKAAGALAAVIEANARVEKGRSLFLLEEDAVRREGLADAHAGVVAPALLPERDPAAPFSPTLLEEYGACPYRYFLARVVRISGADAPEPGVERREEGVLLHGVLEGFYRRMQAEGRLPLRGEEREAVILREVGEEVFARWEEENPGRELLLRETARERLLEMLRRLVETEAQEDDPAVPLLFEERFEMAAGGKEPCLLQGVIDRIDSSADGARLRVVDYKLGGDQRRYSAMLKQENMGVVSFQMPLYLAAVLRGKEVSSLCARYWCAGKGESAQREWRGEELSFFAGGGGFLEKVGETVAKIRAGRFPVTPAVPGACRSCDYGAICRYVEVSVREEEG